jgi:hypothetical protein
MSSTSTTFFRRLLGAALLDPATYEDVEADRAATAQALAVVVFSSLAAGIGARGASGGTAALTFFAGASQLALMAWAAYALVIFEIGAHILPTSNTRVDVGELLRTLGFAATPGLIQVLGILPGAAIPAFTLAVVWTLAASVVAVRQALDFTSTGRALAVCGLALSLTATLAIGLAFMAGVTLSGR